MISEPVTRPFMQCESMYPQTLLGTRCPSCEVVNWKYQDLVIPMVVATGTIVIVTAIFSVYNQL